MSRSAAIVIHDNYTDAEFLVAYHFLKAADFDVIVFSLNGGPVKGVNGWVHKTIDRFGQITHNIDDRLIFTWKHMGDSPVLVLIGGVRSIEYLRQSRTLIEWIREHNAQNKVIASACHGASLLVEADIVRGRKVLGYYSIKTDLLNAGAIWPDSETVVIDGNICSTPHYDFSGIWMRTVIEEWEKRNATDLR
jgi:protease I